MERTTQGLHHITAITSDASSAVNFYTRILGLRLVKKTVNFDDPSAYHLYFGDEKGNPGTLVTFFDWGKSIGLGQVGAGGTHQFAFTTQACEFFAGILNMELAKDNQRELSGTAQQVFGLEGGRPGSIISFVESPVAPHGTVGVGTVHHIAFAVEDEEAQLMWRERLLARGVHVTPVLDRKYFKSIYFREPDGVLLELATIPPGFGVDEPMESLGESLTLPSWLESRRRSIEASLEPISLPA